MKKEMCSVYSSRSKIFPRTHTLFTFETRGGGEKTTTRLQKRGAPPLFVILRGEEHFLSSRTVSIDGGSRPLRHTLVKREEEEEKNVVVVGKVGDLPHHNNTFETSSRVRLFRRVFAQKRRSALPSGGGGGNGATAAADARPHRRCLLLDRERRRLQNRGKRWTCNKRSITTAARL